MSKPPNASTELVLASASPRRRRLAAWLGVSYRCVSVEVAEDLSSPLASDPQALAEEIATSKAVAARVAGETGVVLAFDTIVVLDDRVLGKPSTIEDAYRMLRDLSGREHTVVTGVAVFCPDDPAPNSYAVSTVVMMHRLAETDLEEWASTDEILGCAGAYNIERHLATVDDDQCYQNVAGLPLCHVARTLAELTRSCGISPTSPRKHCDAALGRTCRLGPRLVD